MNYREVLSDLKSLKLYCDDMHKKDPDEVWKEDCEALDMAIFAIRTLEKINKRRQNDEMTIDEAIEHARKVAEEYYLQGMLCHANPDDGKLDNCIKCGKEHEQLADWLEELKQYKNTGLTPDQIREIDRLYSEQAKELGEYKKLGALDKVLEAVEKRKKKKPCASNRCYVCPHCGLVTSIKIKHNYCDACGQHIDWSEKE